MHFRILIALCCLALPAFFLNAARPHAWVRPHQDKQPTTEPAQLDFAKDVVPFLGKYCIDCHSGPKPKANLDFTKFKDLDGASKQKQIWDKVVHNLRRGEMPPSGRPKPPLEQVERLTSWIDETLLAVDCTKQRDPGRVTIRRLNRNEYNNTIRDLLGVHFKPAEDFPIDDTGYGFDNIGDVLSMSPLLMEKYLAAAEKIVDEVFKTPELKKKLFTAAPLPDKLPTDMLPPDKKSDKKQPDKKSDKKLADKPPPDKKTDQKKTDKPLTDKKAQDAAAPAKKVSEKEAAFRAILGPFMQRAYRRPIVPDELDRITRFLAIAEKNGDGFEKGVQLAVQAALCSPYFLFRFEKDFQIAPKKISQPLTQHELATRLSYFLWSSMPDDELFKLAGQNKLRDSAVLEEQVRRMLKDAKATALTENFAGQWLQLRNVASLSPDPQLFPEFDAKLRDAMIKETELFFDHIVKDDRNIYEFLDADWTFVNQRLASHYGMEGIKGEQFRKVQIKGGQRVGVLTHASILSVTSNPTRTSPVKRGKWILENILNAPPPPPVPEAGELSEDEKDISAAPLRKRMELHRTNPSCATCHQRMDPLGFGFENFDAIGAWRTKDGKFDVDASGELPGGQKFIGPKELVEVLKKKETDFRRCLVEKLLTYALGRGLEYFDRCAVDDICADLNRNENRFVALVLAIVKSDAFQLRKGRP